MLFVILLPLLVSVLKLLPNVLLVDNEVVLLRSLVMMDALLFSMWFEAAEGDDEKVDDDDNFVSVEFGPANCIADATDEEEVDNLRAFAEAP